ncbi:hypothetical protein ASG31_11540 [Chryseobacterium sp. Leaf404]|uniref:type VI secretion system TssO n=1 Tax=unclassified Chryseobacterium TaxID=2593645 RepID=UPI0006F263F3|nr:MULTISPECIES: type VI secretion system TssO [unclassified Chryseobacterium]KQT16990.1 hypothetical protein ASG31_11540 [Chryseobacterium sp. Leaf404]
MSVYNDKKLNRSDVRTGIWRFVISFIVLSAVSFTAVFFFFKSYDTQRAGISKEVEKYENLLSKNQLLKISLDSIQYNMSILGANRVENDIYLRESIMGKMRDAKDIMGEDSATNFKHYNVLLKKVEKMLLLKSQIITANNDEQAILRSLNNCQSKDHQILGELRKDPSRIFTGRRR